MTSASPRSCSIKVKASLIAEVFSNRRALFVDSNCAEYEDYTLLKLSTLLR